MFIKEEPIIKIAKGVKIGSLAEKGYQIPEDFNEPLSD